MDARPCARVVAVLAVALGAAACGSDDADSVVLPGLDAGRELVVPTAPPVPTSAPPVTGSGGSTDDQDASDDDGSSGDGSTGGAGGSGDDTPSDDTSSDDTPADDSQADEGSTDDTPTDDVTETVPAPTTPAPAPTTTVEIEYLRIGDEGPAVASVQRRLIALEYLAEGGDTGVFDRATADALIDFQAQYGLIVDGVFGPQTDRALNAAAASVD